MSSLPFERVIPVTAADADKYPDFIALLQAIETRFAAAAEAEGGAGAGASADEDDDKADAPPIPPLGAAAAAAIERDGHKTLFFQQKILLDAAHKVARGESENARQLKRRLAEAEAAQMLPLFGLEDERQLRLAASADVQRPSSLSAADEAGSLAVPEIEQIIGDRSQALARFYGGSLADIETDVLDIRAEEKGDHFMPTADLAAQVEYARLALRRTALMGAVADDHKSGRVFEFDSLQTKWLMARAHTMCLKLGVVEQQFLKDTYTPETVGALDKVRAHLKEAYDEAVTDYERARVRLERYEALGEEFTDLAKEYARLTKELQDKEWAMKELQR